MTDLSTSITAYAKQFKEEWKKDETKELKEKIAYLEKIIEDLSKRLDYLENNLCH